MKNEYAQNSKKFYSYAEKRQICQSKIVDYIHTLDKHHNKGSSMNQNNIIFK